MSMLRGGIVAVLLLLLASSCCSVVVVSGFVVVVVGRTSSSSSSRYYSASERSRSTAFVVPQKRVASPLFLALSNDNDQAAQQQQELQQAAALLFRQYCDDKETMSKETLKKMEFIDDLLSNEDLLEEEFQDIWNAAAASNETRIDLASFLQIYQDIDDLFEEINDSDSEESITTTTTETINDNEQTVPTPPPNNNEQELESVFYNVLCAKNKDSGNNQLVSKKSLREWSEVDKLLSEGLLGDDEFEELWTQSSVSSSSSNELMMDLEGFYKFNSALDDLFVFDEDDQEEEKDEAMSIMVIGGDLPPGVLFAQLANTNNNNLVGRQELERWVELQQMLDDEELLPLELQNILEEVPKAKGTDDMLDQDGFTVLFESIEALFEDVEDDDDGDDDGDDKPVSTTDTTPTTTEESNEAKSALLSLIEEINSDEERLPCGLESTEREERQVQQIVTALEESSPNVITQKQGNIDLNDLEGEWELLYSSSSAMKFNKGLSGLGGSVPNGRFGGLMQTLKASKYLTDVEYIERIEVNPSSASFDVRVTGGWDLRTSVSLFTGAPSTVMTVEPDKVTYGPTSTRADHWKSLGPLNMLDVTYLDDDLRVMRGNTSTDTIFVFRRISS